MDPRSEESFSLEFGDSRVDCRPGNLGLIRYELEIPEAVLPHGSNYLNVLSVQEVDEAVDLSQVLFRGELAQRGVEENVEGRELFKLSYMLGIVFGVGGPLSPSRDNDFTS